MSDMLDEALAAFDTHLGVEPEAPTEGAPEPDGGTPEADGQPRDEQGRFAAQDQPEPETPETPAEPATIVPADDKYVSYLSRFGLTSDEVGGLPEQAQKALQAGFEADSLVGRRGQEYGELKKEFDQLRQTVEQNRPQPQQPQTAAPQHNPDEVAEWFAERPAAILPTIQQAYRDNDRALVYLGIKALEEYDPVTAEGLRIEIAKQDALAELTPQITPLRERVEQASMNDVTATAGAQFKASHPDFAQYSAAMNALAEKNPHLLAGLQEGTPEGVVNTLETLYKLAAFDARQQGDQVLTAAQQQAAEQQQLEAKAAKHDAFVATGTQRVDPEPQETDPLLDAFDRAASRFAPRD